MNIIFVGVQGSGKGTQAKIIARKLGLCHISTGDLLRETTGELRKEIDSYITVGKLVPDDLILKMLLERMEQDDCKKGIILDGYPRKIVQAETLDTKITVDEIIEIAISDETALHRLEGRLTCKKCGHGFNERTEPKPNVKGVCNDCGGALFSRDDDHKEAILERIATYHKETKKVLDHYKGRAVTINGEQSIEKVTEDILKVLEKR